MRRLEWRVAVLVAVLALATMVWGQTAGSVTGTVHDNSGAVVAGAEVTVSNAEKAFKETATTNGNGDYLIAAVPAGSYDVTITAKGFKEFHVKNLVVRVTQKVRVDAALEVGKVDVEVVVEGAAVAQVETQSSELAGTVTGKEISQLQLNGRNFTQLVTLVPGVSNQTGADEAAVGIIGSVAFSINGGRTEYNNWELDGGDNMDNGSNATLNVYPSLDSISEFRVLTSNYGAQYGRNGSGTIEVETKSGTKSFHGNAYEFVRNDAFNARNYFESSVPPYKRNDFGYTIGGPIFIPNVYNKDRQKTFFFWSQEWRRQRDPSVFNVSVPSAAERAGNFSDLCPNLTVTDPSQDPWHDCPYVPGATPQITNAGNPYTPDLTLLTPNPNISTDPNVQALLGLIPPANSGDPGAAFYNASPSTPTTWREELIRVDHNLTSKVRGTFRYIHDSWNTVQPTTLWTGSSFPTVQTQFTGPALSLVTRITANLSPTLLNEFVFSYTTDHILLSSTGTPDPKAWQRPASVTFLGLVNSDFGGKLPAITLTGGDAYNGGFYEDPNGIWPEGAYNSNPTFTYRDNLSKIVGRHNLAMGFYLAAAQKNELSSVQVNGSLGFDRSSLVSTGNPFADFLLGRVDSYSQGSKQLKFYNRYKLVEPYFQDDWRITDRLTLNLGLRVSLFGTYRERYKNAYNWDPAAFTGSGLAFDGLVQCGVGSVPAGCMKGHLFNPAPRIGFAYDPTGRGKTAIRGGYGVFFEHTNGNEGNTESLEGQSSPAIQNASQNLVVGYNNLGTGAGGFPLNYISIPSKAVWPYMQQWHFDVQHELRGNVVATVSYVGSKGTHLTRILDSNQIRPVTDAENPYKPGEAIGPNDCTTFTTPSGVAITGQAAINLQVACGADPNQFRTAFPGLGTITRLEDTASSIYHSLQMSGRKNIGGLELSAAYTYSHSIDDSSDRGDSGFVDSYNMRASRASSTFDMRHQLNVSYVYDMPFFRGHGLRNSVLGGWQVSGIAKWNSGLPFSATNALDFPDNAGVGNGVGTSSYPDLAGKPNAGVRHGTSSATQGPLYYDPSLFVAPRGLTFGNAGRNSLRSPGRVNFDMALFKRFAIKESMAFEFRAEAFNVFNHTQWAPISGQAGSAGNNGTSAGTNACCGADFMHLNAAYSARKLQLGAKFIF